MLTKFTLLTARKNRIQKDKENRQIGSVASRIQETGAVENFTIIKDIFYYRY